MKIIEIQPLLVGALDSMTIEDIENVVRQTRNFLLQQCDWTQLADSPLSDTKREEWRVYRQNLRDIPNAYAGDIMNAEFPAQPE